MKKTILISLVCSALVCAFVLPSLHAAPKAPADMTIEMPKGQKATKAPVAFSHAKHKALDCKACHHKWDGKGDVKGCSSAGCHEDYKAKKGDKSFYGAFHAATSKNSCLGCHKDLKTAKKPTGPTACTQCHPQKK
ncbi:MAG: cytochrome c3 family protein [Desulfovibrionaceae bacterium]|nr:cytochrome c3 family protein [Desulfovibrionaceae bacterium]